MRLFFGGGTDRPVRVATDVRDYLPPDKCHQYAEGYSMAETAKAWLRANGCLPPSMANIVGDDRLETGHFEYPTKVWGGGLSMTDVMAFIPGSVIAVEGKVREPFDDEVSTWIGREEHSNKKSPDHRRAVIKRYAQAFNVGSEERLFDVRYQLLHRTLSAALTARRRGATRAWMIVQSFAPIDCPEHTQNRADFDRYIGLVGSTPILKGVSVRLAWAQER